MESGVECEWDRLSPAAAGTTTRQALWGSDRPYGTGRLFGHIQGNELPGYGHSVPPGRSLLRLVLRNSVGKRSRKNEGPKLSLNGHWLFVAVGAQRFYPERIHFFRWGSPDQDVKFGQSRSVTQERALFFRGKRRRTSLKQLVR
jgi:hypothetical protein